MKNLVLGTLLAIFFAAPVVAGDFAVDTAPIIVADAHSAEQDDNRGIGDERSEEAKQFGDREHGKKKGHEKREDGDKKEKKKKKDKSEDDEDDEDDEVEDDDEEDEDGDKND